MRIRTMLLQNERNVWLVNVSENEIFTGNWSGRNRLHLARLVFADSV